MQVEQLRESVSICGGLADTQEPKRKYAVEKGLKMASHQLKTIEEAWRGMFYVSFREAIC